MQWGLDYKLIDSQKPPTGSLKSRRKDGSQESPTGSLKSRRKDGSQESPTGSPELRNKIKRNIDNPLYNLELSGNDEYLARCG